MKKFIFIMPLMAVSLLASCGGSKQIKYHTITFNSNEGSEVPTLIVEDGKLAIEPKDPIKDAMVFAGWYKEDTLDNYFDFSKTTITQDYNLYARWEGEFEYKVTLESDNKLTLKTTGGFFDQSNYTSRILLKDEYRNKYDLPYSKDYYEVTVNDNPIDNFEIEQVIYGTELEYYVNITIPKELLGYDIEIKTEPYCHYLTFTAEEAGATLFCGLSSPYSPSVLPELQFCTDLDDENWLDWKFGDEGTITFSTIGETIYVKNTLSTFSEPNKHLRFWDNDKKISAGGNIMSLINFGKLKENCFADLFAYSYITTAPVLPATVLSPSCYDDMFGFCANLTTAPVLPATTLSSGCYSLMFVECDRLTTAPVLPATILQPYCYQQMFRGCDDLLINNSGKGVKFLTCPDTSPSQCVFAMFGVTGGTYTADPIAGESYYYTLD